MVKSVSSCCVRGSRVLSNPVTYLCATMIIIKEWSCMIHNLANLDNVHFGDFATNCVNYQSNFIQENEEIAS